MAIPVLMYHAIEDAGHPAGATESGEQRYVLQARQFRDQMSLLKEQGFRTLLLDELLTLREPPEKALVLTFDDGHVSNFNLALPILLEHGFKAHFFLTTGWIGDARFMSEEQIRQLRSAGMAVGSHGVTHRFLDDLDRPAMERELLESKQRLELILGEEVTSFSAPGGRIHPAMRCGSPRFFDHVFGSVPGTFSSMSPGGVVPRLSVMASTSMDEFSKMVHGEVWYLTRERARFLLLRMLKRALGNDLYQQLRRATLSRSNVVPRKP